MAPRVSDRGLVFDVIDEALAEKFFKRNVAEGEKVLLAAVLLDAIEEQFQTYAQSRDKKGKELFRDVEFWIAETNSDSFFSFENICENLGLSPGRIRQQLLHCESTRAPRAKPTRKPHKRATKPKTR